MRQISRTSMGILCVLAILVCPSAARADNPTMESYTKAREVIDAAVAAAGGAERLNGIETVALTTSGTGWARNQSPKVDRPYEANQRDGRLILDLAGNRLLVEFDGEFPGGVFATRTVITADAKFVLNLRAKTIQHNDALDPANFDFWHRLFPPLMLRKAVQQAASLHYLGISKLDGKPHHMVSFAWDNGLTPTLYIDTESHMVSKYELLFPDNLTGDAVSELAFPGYRDVDGIQVPVGYTQTIAGDLAADIRYTDVRINTPVDDAEFDAPYGFRGIAPPPTGSAKVVELADDVYLVDGLANFGYSVFWVAFDDYILVFDAPVNRAVTAQAIGLIKAEVPDKPIRYAVLSHHHDDHSGGIAAFVDEGTTIVTTKANQAYLEQMAASSSTLAGEPTPEPGKPTFEFVDHKRVFSDAGHLVEVHDIGPGPHAEEMLIFYLPKEKMVHQGDLLGIPRSGSVAPANDVTVHFAEAIRELGLDVKFISDVHGTVGNITDLDLALAKRKALDAKG
jgi:glyoxylase-like metal-dependent hydrolase (beta-lactamase superfamily II)